MNSFVRNKEKETKSYNSIPYGYGMRAYRRLKSFADKTGPIRETLIKMTEEDNIPKDLLIEAIRLRILPDGLIKSKLKGKDEN